MSPAITPEQKPYRPYGKAFEVLYFKGDEFIFSGPAGTGKSRVCLEKMHLCAEKYAGMRGLIVRKTRSSAEGEYPVQQSGELHAGVDWQPTNDPLVKEVFIAGNDEGKLLGLEFSPPSQNPNREGSPKRTSGGRAPMWRTFSGPQTHERMLDAMEVE